MEAFPECLQIRYDEIVTLINATIREYDASLDGSSQKFNADEKLKELHRRKMSIEREISRWLDGLT